MQHLILVFLLISASAAAQTPPPSPSQRPDYVVGAQDVLKVSVFDEPQLSGTFRVDTDGSFTYPFVGRVKALGQTLRSIESELARMLGQGYVRNAQVSIEVEQYRSRSFFVVGEVRAPGRYPLSGEMTLIEALAQAGSTTPAAGSELLVLHAVDSRAAQPGGNGEGGAASRTTRVNLADLQSGKLANNIILREGDTIFVAKAERFFVTGHVRNPGAFTWERGITVLQAVSLAGGLSDRGSSRGIRVIRIVGGAKKEMGLKLSDLLEPGDTLVIRQRLL
jgi:polysaccharide biosynthesis/export protein